MRKLLLLAVSVSLVFTASTMARGIHNSAPQNNQYSEQYDSDDDGTDWEDHTLPSPKYDSQSSSFSMCGNHTVFMNQDDNVLTVDGITYQLMGTDYRKTENDVALIDHYVLNRNNPDKLVSLMVFQKSKQVLFYKNGESHSVSCHKPKWN